MKKYKKITVGCQVKKIKASRLRCFRNTGKNRRPWSFVGGFIGDAAGQTSRRENLPLPPEQFKEGLDACTDLPRFCCAVLAFKIEHWQAIILLHGIPEHLAAAGPVVAEFEPGADHTLHSPLRDNISKDGIAMVKSVND